MPRKFSSTLSYVGYILVLIGGIVIVLFGVLDSLGVAIRIFRYASALAFLSGAGSALLQIVIGVVCTIGARFVSGLVWAVILLVLGVFSGAPGGVLVAVGALLGLVSVLLKNAPK